MNMRPSPLGPPSDSFLNRVLIHQHPVLYTPAMTEDLVSTAVDRSLRNRRSAAEVEVARLLETGRDLLGAGTNPKVGEIVKAAKVSNEAFYRYFGSKDRFVAAVVEDGCRRMVAHVEHKLSGHADPAQQLHVVIDAMLKQAGPRVGRSTRNILALSRASNGAREQVTFEETLASVFEPVLVDLGSSDPRRDARASASAVIGVLQDLLWNEQAPTAGDTDHLARFLLAAVSRPATS